VSSMSKRVWIGGCLGFVLGTILIILGFIVDCGSNIIIGAASLPGTALANVFDIESLTPWMVVFGAPPIQWTLFGVLIAKGLTGQYFFAKWELVACGVMWVTLVPICSLTLAIHWQPRDIWPITWINVTIGVLISLTGAKSLLLDNRPTKVAFSATFAKDNKTP